MWIRRSSALVALAVTVALTATACGQSSSTATAVSAASAPADSVATQKSAATPQPNTASAAKPQPSTAQPITGRAALAAAQAEGKPYVLWFWGAYCADCQVDSAAVVKATNEMGDTVPIIGVPSPQDTPEDRQRFLEEISAPVPQVTDDPLSLWVEHGVAATSTFVYVDSSGNTETSTGAVYPKAFITKLQTLADDPHALG